MIGFEIVSDSTPHINKEKGERILHIFRETGLYEGTVKSTDKPGNGVLYVTNHRLAWSDEQASCFNLPLENISSLGIEAGFLRSSPKLLLTYKSAISKSAGAVGAAQQLDWICDICQYINNTKGKCAQCGVLGKATISCLACTFQNEIGLGNCEMCGTPLPSVGKDVTINQADDFKTKIAFRGRNVVIQDVQSIIQLAIDKRDRDPHSISSPSSSPSSSTTDRMTTITKMGVTGILKNMDIANKKIESTVSDESFKDLESLMDKAAEMTRLAESLITKVSKSSPALDSQDQDGEFSTASFQKDLIDFGIVQPVTKETSGSKYFQELAKELGGFLSLYSKKTGITQFSLSDAFCLFNRARGIALVSPQDVYRASTQMKSLALPFELKTFDSGVNILEFVGSDRESLSTQIIRLLKEKEGGMTATSIASSLNVSVIVSKEQLLAAEKMGLVCRDDTVHGVCFYYNLFREYNE